MPDDKVSNHFKVEDMSFSVVLEKAALRAEDSDEEEDVQPEPERENVRKFFFMFFC